MTVGQIFTKIGGFIENRQTFMLLNCNCAKLANFEDFLNMLRGGVFSWTQCIRCKTRISCRWQTRATHCNTTNLLQTSKCDKLATELSSQRFVPKVANLKLLRLHLTYPACIWRLRWGWHHSSFAESLDYPGLSCGIVYVILHLAFSVEHRLVTDKWTDRNMMTADTRGN